MKGDSDGKKVATRKGNPMPKIGLPRCVDEENHNGLAGTPAGEQNSSRKTPRREDLKSSDGKQDSGSETESNEEDNDGSDCKKDSGSEMESNAANRSPVKRCEIEEDSNE